MPSAVADTSLYFDCAAAAPVSPAAAQRLAELFGEYFANQEAHGAHARRAAGALREAERRILALFAGSSADLHSLFWTMSGTESVAASFRAIRLRFPHGCDILYSDAEHPSALAAIAALPEPFRKIRLPLDRSGRLVPEAVTKALGTTRGTVLCAPFVQSETGAVQDLALLRRLLSSGTGTTPHLLFCDGIQGAGKLPLNWNAVRPDLFTFSGQKIGCPAGGGVIAAESFAPFLRRVRTEEHAAGRLPAPFGILLVERLEELFASMETRTVSMRRTRARLLTLLSERIGGKFEETLQEGTASPYILHLLLKDVQGAIAVRALSAEGISAASGSACDAESADPSRVLTAMGIPREKAYGGFRLSFFEPPDEEALCVLADSLQTFFRDY